MHEVRAWGQNFLVNEGAADTIVKAFRPSSADRVLEIGPGRGVLTRRLLGRVERLKAVEIDPVLSESLREEFGDHEGVAIVTSDVLKIDLPAFLREMGATPERRARVIASLPYSSATAIVLKLLGERDLIGDLLIVVQREVAERIASRPGGRTYGSLSILCQSSARVETLLRLKPGSFRPIPKVESMLVRLTLDPPATPGAGPPGSLEALLRVAFGQRRKTLQNNLARLPGPNGTFLGVPGAAELIRRAGLDPRARPETIPVEGFKALLHALRAL